MQSFLEMAKGGELKQFLDGIKGKGNFAITDMEEAARVLEETITSSFEQQISGLGKVAVMFSGGLDSTLLAHLASKHANVTLISVGASDSPDMVYSIEVAKALHLPLITVDTRGIDFDAAARKCMNVLKLPDPVWLPIAVLFHLAAVECRKFGLKDMLVGQGADELFLGYHDCAQLYGQWDALEKLFWDMLYHSWEWNTVRDYSIVEAENVRIHLPYFHPDVIKAAASVHPSLNINSKDDELRKRVLREVGRRLGVPKLALERKKHAGQYGSWIMKLYEKEAKKHKDEADKAGYSGRYMQYYAKKLYKECCKS